MFPAEWTVCPSATTEIAHQTPASREEAFMSKPYRSPRLVRASLRCFCWDRSTRCAFLVDWNGQAWIVEVVMLGREMIFVEQKLRRTGLVGSKLRPTGVRCRRSSLKEQLRWC